MIIRVAYLSAVFLGLVSEFCLVGFAQDTVKAISTGPPRVEKVEPPDWWANHSISPVRVMVRGANFQGARVTSRNADLKTSNVRINSRGDYIFFDLAIAKNTRPAKYNIGIAGAGGKTIFTFGIDRALDTTTHFKGISNDDVIYLIMTDRFADGDPSNDLYVDRKNPRAWHGGDFRGIIGKLPYLKELGITAIWLTPWYDNPNEPNQCDKPWCPYTNFHGYHPIDYYGVEDHFGTMADLRELVEKAHAAGIKVIQDQVANHVGIQHPWAKKTPLENWFSKFKQNTFNNSALLSPNASPSERDDVLKGWFNELLPDLDQTEPEVARYEIQNALWWIGATGIDGIRQDTIQYMPRKFIHDWSAAIKKQYPKFWMVGEVFERDSAQTAFFQGGKTSWDGVDTKLPSVFDFKLWDTSTQVFTGKKPMRALREVLKYDGLYPDIDNVTVLQNNHDTKRFMSLDSATLEGAMLHLGFLLTTRGIPQLYYGEEIAMHGGEDPFNRDDFPGGWVEDKEDRLVSREEKTGAKAMYRFTKNWIDIRRSYPALKAGKTIDLKYDDDIYVFARQYKGETVVVVINRGEKDTTVEISNSDLDLSDEIYSYGAKGVRLPKDKDISLSQNGNVKLFLPAKNIVAYDVKKVLR
jgi:neopullulanase